jgi:hypothetical protein
MLTYDVLLLHDKARPHTTDRTRPLLEHFNWELLFVELWTPVYLHEEDEEVVRITAL